MLDSLVKHIERALISYIKCIDRLQPSQELNSGLMTLVAQSQLLSTQRKNDICAIDQLCEEALDQNQTPKTLIQNLILYVKKMKTGFIFFSGNSKLRDRIISAIEQYDLQYLTWKQGVIYVDETYKECVPLKGKRDKVDKKSMSVWQSNKDVLGPVQSQIKDLVAQMQQQKRLLEDYRAEVRMLTDILNETQSDLAKTRIELADTQAENIQLLSQISDSSPVSMTTLSLSREEIPKNKVTVTHTPLTIGQRA